MIDLATGKKFLLAVLILVCLLPFVPFHEQVDISASAPSGAKSPEENPYTVHVANNASSAPTDLDQEAARVFKENFSQIIQGGHEALQLSPASDSPSFTRHLMCKDHDLHYNPIHPTTIFRPSDIKAVCLTTVNISDMIEFRWHYRNDSSKTWVSCYNWSRRVFAPGGYAFESHLMIAGYSLYCPRAYKVDVYLDGSYSFSEFFEITNGGINSPRTCEDVNIDERRPINIKSRFTIGVDSKVHHYLSFSKIAYFNDELGHSHNFTTAWIQPDGSTYKTYSGSFADYKDVDVNWNSWELAPYDPYDYIYVNSTTPTGNWKVEVYLDSYFNNTWVPYGPVATTPFVVGSEPVADWTVMAYLDGDINIETAGIEIFEKIAGVGPSSQVNIVAQLDRIPGYNSSYGDWTDCKRFNVTKDMTPTPGNAIPDFSGEKNMGHPDTLNDFIKWTMNYFPANRYFLVLWNHGAGFMGVCLDTTNINDTLSLPELSQALTGLPAMLDVVLVDACSMGMLEVAYQIRDYSNVLIAPAGLGYTPAPYDYYVSDLTNNPLSTPSVFATEVVNYYIDWCQSIDDVWIPNATMLAIDLTKTTSLIAAIDDFASTLKEKETLVHEQLNLARNLTQGYQGPYGGDTGYHIDLYHFAELIYQQVNDQELRNAARQVRTELSTGNAIIAKAHKAVRDSHGPAVFFPEEKQKYEDLESTYEKTAFAEDTLWDAFVKHHLDLQTDGCILAIQTPFSNILVEIDEEPYTTDSQGKLRAFVLPDSYVINVPTLVYPAEPGSRGIFIRWHDYETNCSRTVTVTGSTTYTAYYETQCEVTFSQSGIITGFSGTAVTIDGAGYNVTSLPASFWWGNSTTHTFAFHSPLLATPNSKRYVWNSSQGMSSAQSQQITVSTSGIIVGYYKTQFFLGLATDPHGVTTPSGEGWYYNGTDATIFAEASVDITIRASRYQFKTWTTTDMTGISDCNSTSSTVRMDKARIVTADYVIQYYLTVNSPHGQPSPTTGWFETGSFINTSVTSPASGSPGTRYACIGWVGTGGVNAIGADTSTTFIIEEPSNITWRWKTQYLLTVNTDPAGLSPTPNVSQAGPWYDNGTLVNCTSQEINGYAFDFWTVDGANWDPGIDEIAITMDRPHEAVTHYTKVVAWWETLPYPQTLQIIIGLIGVAITATLVRTAWVTTRKRREIMKERPVAIEATEVLPNRVNTGYADLDNVLFGGIPKNYAVILTSPSCDERDLLIKRILETGAKNGEVTFYLTIDPGEARSLAEEFQSSFYLFICNPQANRIIKDLPNVFKLKGVENLTEINIALTKAFRRLDASTDAPRRACIDIVSDVLLQHQAVRTRRWLTELVTDFKSRGFTTLAAMNPQMHSPQEVHAILGLFEGEINVYEREEEEKFLKVKKLYNQRYLECEMPLRKEKLDK